MPTGFGNSPFGQFSFGTGTPDEAPPQLGITEAARFIDPISKDFTSTQGDGRLDAMPRLHQRIILALTTTAGSSSAMPNLGLDLTSARVIDSTFQNRVKGKVKFALKQLTDIEKVMRITDIAITQGSSGRTSIVLSFVDLTTQLPDTITV